MMAKGETMAGSSPSTPTTLPPPFPYEWPEIRESRSDDYNFNNRIMLAAILSLAFVITLVVALHVYARYILRRQRRATITIFRAATVARDAPDIRGLDPAAIAKLPMFSYRLANGRIASECAVCLSAVEEGEMVRVLHNCKHVFHVECVDMWLGSHSTCPVCRAAVEPPAAAVEVEKGEASDMKTRAETSGCGEGGVAAKETGSVSRLSESFRRMMMNRGRSGRRVQDHVEEDLERQ